jgi:DNA-directed RNA polymerase subunit RPC12/RpoP
MTADDDAKRHRCAECGREQTASERGWRAYLATDEEEPAEAVLYCPECAEREFGDGRNVRNRPSQP